MNLLKLLGIFVLVSLAVATGYAVAIVVRLWRTWM